MSLTRRLFAGLLCAFLIAGCSEGPGDDDANPNNGGPQGTGPSGEATHAPAGGSWTVLVYMVADNNLEPAAVDDLKEMMAVGSSDKLRFLVQVDRAVGYSADPIGNLADFTSTKRVKVEKGSLAEVADLGELNMGTPAALADFIEWGVKNAPADRYAIVFWDHGGAWPGFGGDESTQDHDLLDLAELKQGLTSGMEKAGIKRFSLIGYDACLMATVEVALAMRPFGEYLLASEELEPGHGWDYRSFEPLRNNPALLASEWGRHVVDGFLAQAKEAKTDAKITLALVDLYALGDIEAALTELGAMTADEVKASATALARERASSLSFGEMPDPRRSTHMVDLGVVLTKGAQAQARLAGARDKVNTALGKAVLHKTSGQVTSAATGLSIYFPTQQAYYNAAYDTVEETKSWRTFVKNYFGAGVAVGTPTFTNPNDQADGSLTNMLVLQGTLATGSASSIAKATMGYGVVLSQTVYILGERPAAFNEQVVQGSWNLQMLTVSQGYSSGYGYVSLGVTNDSELSVTIPIQYEVSGQQAFVIRSILFNSSGSVVQDTYYVSSEGGFSELYPEPGSTLMPLVMVLSGNSTSWDSGGDHFDATEPLLLGFQGLTSGFQVYGSLTIQNIAGQGDMVWATGYVP